jgi:hypothetical protein
MPLCHVSFTVGVVGTSLLLMLFPNGKGLTDRTSLSQPPFHSQSQGLNVTDSLPQPYGQEKASLSFVSDKYSYGYKQTKIEKIDAVTKRPLTK